VLNWEFPRATGITTSDVEAMEESFKRDVIREVRAGNGRVLLHDEVEERPNVFAIVPLWENVSEEDIMTPGDVFNLMAREGYKVSYFRSYKGALISDILLRRLIMAVLLLYVESPFWCSCIDFLQTDEQAPLPGALSQLLERVTSAYESAGDFVFNCQMGRGRTTTGMVTACLIATVMNLKRDERTSEIEPDSIVGDYDTIDGPSEEEAYLQGTIILNQTPVFRSWHIFLGEYKVILQLVGVLSHGKTAKRLTDGAIDLMQDVQNLRKAIYECVNQPPFVGATLHDTDTFIRIP
jgi:hypothetical protein